MSRISKNNAMAAVEPTARLSRSELVSLANVEAVTTYLAGLPKEVVETVDTALLIDGNVLPVHQLVLISSSAMLRDLLSSQATLQGSQVHMIPLIHDEQACVQDALAYMYQRIMLSTKAPKVADIKKAKHMVKFGHKYGVQLLLDEGDAFSSEWCKINLSGPDDHHHKSAPERRQYAIQAAQEVVEWIVFAEGASLHSTLMVCETWFVQHIWDLTLSLKRDALSDILAQISSHALARIMSAVAHKNRLYIR